MFIIANADRFRALVNKARGYPAFGVTRDGRQTTIQTTDVEAMREAADGRKAYPVTPLVQKILDEANRLDGAELAEAAGMSGAAVELPGDWVDKGESEP